MKKIAIILMLALASPVIMASGYDDDDGGNTTINNRMNSHPKANARSNSSSRSNATGVGIGIGKGGNAKAYGGSAYSRSYAKGGAGGEGGTASIHSYDVNVDENVDINTDYTEQGQSQGAYADNAGVTGNDVSISTTSTYQEAAQAGSVGLSVAYDCGGTAGGYVGVPGINIGGGGSYVFETCEDVYVAMSADKMGLPGGQTFMKAILARRMVDFEGRNAGYTGTSDVSAPDGR